MSVIELRHDLITMIMSIEKEKTLLKVISLLKEDADEDDWWEDIPFVHRERILKSYKESFDSKNWVSHEEALKRHAKWLQK